MCFRCLAVSIFFYELLKFCKFLFPFTIIKLEIYGVQKSNFILKHFLVGCTKFSRTNIAMKILIHPTLLFQELLESFSGIFIFVYIMNISIGVNTRFQPFVIFHPFVRDTFSGMIRASRIFFFVFFKIKVNILQQLNFLTRKNVKLFISIAYVILEISIHNSLLRHEVQHFFFIWILPLQMIVSATCFVHFLQCFIVFCP
mmetsp:Transcript_16909/g.38045  ORF Transcript_16909/g.38045 Transcript_16909/m.38045 type:complete len:200 (+) Transcript_16909:1557-2156(+)